MRKFITVVLAVLLSYPLWSQPLVIVDGDTGRPVEAVVITDYDGRIFAVTDSAGVASISDFIGEDSIVLRHVGYKTVTVSYNELRASSPVYYLLPSDIRLKNVVVSATRWRQPSEQVPYRITGISPDEVALQNPQTTADLLSGSGEVFVQKSQQGGGSPMIRGFSANRLLYAVDGVRMNTAIFRSGNLQNVISLDPFAIEKTEVLFGPGSVIYGSDAIGGVMAFNTLVPKLRNAGERVFSGNALVRYASANREKTGHLHLGYGSGRWSAITSISGFSFGDLRMGRNGPDCYKRKWYVQRIGPQDVQVENPDPLVQVPTGYTQLNIMQKVRYMPNGRWDLRYGFHHSATSEIPRYDRLILDDDSLPTSAEWHYGPQIWLMNNLSARHLHSGLYDQMTLRLAHQYFEESRIDRDFGDVLRRRREEQVHAVSLNADFIVAPANNLGVFYGVEAVVNDVRSTGAVTDIANGGEFPGPSRYPQSRWTSLAAYATAQYEISDRVLSHAGIRYNQVLLSADFSNNAIYYPLPVIAADLNTGALTGNAGLVVHPSSNWKIGLNLSTGFRAPNVDDIGKIFDSEPGSVVVPNPTLRPEYAYNGEVSVNRHFREAVDVYVSAYFTYLDNAMVRRDYTIDGMDSILYDGILSRVQAVQNAAAVRVMGIQAGFEWRIPFDFVLESKINYQSGRELLDEGGTYPARHVAPLFGRTSLTYIWRGLRAQINAVYNGPIGYEDLAPEERGKPHLYAADDFGNPYAPAWFTLNLKTSYQWSDRFTLTAGVENITSARYRTFSSGIAASGTNFMMALSVSF